MESTITVASVFEPIFDPSVLDIILESGRNGGKSKTAYILSGVMAAMNPQEDIVIARASSSSIKDSSYNEVCEVFDSIDEFSDNFNYRTSPCRISRKDGGTTIYFIGVGGSKERTKGIKPVHKVGLLILEEAQELRSQEHYDQTLASLRRRFGDECKVLTIFNPPNSKNHWINVWCSKKKMDKDYTVIHSSWRDISRFLKDRDIKEILKIKRDNPEYYNYIYEGIPNESGSIYCMFYTKRHVISRIDYDYLLSIGIRPVLAIISGDGAVTHDATAFVLKLIMSNGCAVNIDKFYHDPQQDGQLSSHQLVSLYLTKWFTEVCSKYHLGTVEEIIEAQRRGVRINVIPIYMRIDSAATDLIKECQFYFSNRCINVLGYHKQMITEMVGFCQNAIGSDNEYIVDNGGYYSYVRNKWIKTDEDILVNQIIRLAWNEKGNGYDNTIPNDMCDAWTYGTCFWFKNTENIHNFELFKSNCVNMKKICDILNDRNERN